MPASVSSCKRSAGLGGAALLALPLLLLLTVGRAAALDFELARVDGAGFVRLSELPPALTLVNFWRADCPPCVAELPLLRDAAPRLGFRLITVALQTARETRAFRPAITGDAPRHLALQGPVEARVILRRFGNPSGVLPHSVLLAADGAVCASRSGPIDAAWLAANLPQCGSGGPSP